MKQQHNKPNWKVWKIKQLELKLTPKEDAKQSYKEYIRLFTEDEHGSRN